MLIAIKWNNRIEMKRKEVPFHIALACLFFDYKEQVSMVLTGESKVIFFLSYN